VNDRHSVGDLVVRAKNTAEARTKAEETLRRQKKGMKLFKLTLKGVNLK